MPLQVKEIEFEAERERLREEMEDTAEEQAEWATGDGTNAEYLQQLQARGTTLQEYRRTLGKAIEGELEPLPAFDGVTLAGLSPGDINRAEDFADEHDNVRFRDAFVAIGTHDAPYLRHDPEGVTAEEYAATVGEIVDSVPLPFIRWAEERISDFSHLGGEMGNEYTRLLLENVASKMGDGENG